MKLVKSVLVAAVVSMGAAGSMAFGASVGDVRLYLDTAPNVYGSPDWPSMRLRHMPTLSTVP